MATKCPEKIFVHLTSGMFYILHSYHTLVPYSVQEKPAINFLWKMRQDVENGRTVVSVKWIM